MNDIPLSLYIHIPWCIKKCPYCDFNSHEKNQRYNEDRYIEALIKDFSTEYAFAEDRTITSIFFGGGTPSLFSAESIDRILTAINDSADINTQIEITLEANPGTFEQEKFSGYRDAGINRLSIGTQSFNENHLKNLGRIHDSDQASFAIDAAQTAGFKKINIDLMFGLPDQTIDEAILDINTAIKFDVSHLSHYQLTIEPNTYFNKYPPVLPDNDYLWEMQKACHATLADYDYQQYEVSAFAKDNAECKHNYNYWLFGDYLGIGAGAHGKVTDSKTMQIKRRQKCRQPQEYIETVLKNKRLENYAASSQIIKKEDVIFEFLMNSLRLKEGFSVDIFEQRTGLKRQDLLKVCQNLDDSLLNIESDHIKTSDHGYRFLNNVLEQLL